MAKLFMKQSVVFAILFAGALSVSAEIKDGLIAHFDMDRLDGQGKVVDLSGNGRDLTLEGGAVLKEGGVVGKALYINGEDGSCGSFVCPAMKERTISMWFCRDANDTITNWGSSGAYNPNRYLFDGFSTQNALYYRDNASVSVTGYYAAYTNLNQYGNAGVSFQGSISLKRWYLLTWTYGETEENGQLFGCMRFYVDGSIKKLVKELVGGRMEGGDQSYSAFLGCNTARCREVHGMIDEVRIYDRELTPDEVFELVRERSPKKPYVRFNMNDFVEENGVRYVVDTIQGMKLEVGAAVSLKDGPDGVKALWYDGSTAGWAQGTFPTTGMGEDGDFGEYTVSCWIYRPSDFASCPTYVENGNHYPRLLCFNGEGVKYQVDYGGKVLAYIPSAGGTVGNFPYAFRAYDEWSFFTMSVHRVVEDGVEKTFGTLYLNGQKTSTTEKQLFSSQIYGKCGMIVGSNLRGGNRCWYGGIGDLCIYRGALNDDEVKQLYLRPTAVSAGEDRAVSSDKVYICGTVAESPRQRLWNEGYATIWKQVSGPTATIVNPMNRETMVELSEKGTYVFRFEVGPADSDELTVVYGDSAGASAPTVSVAADSAEVSLPRQLGLTATATGENLSYRWRKMAGPGGVWFEPADMAVAKATFSGAGVYTLACEVTDGEHTASDTVDVIVNAGDELPAPNVYVPFDGIIGDAFVKNVDLGLGLQDLARNTFQSAANYKGMQFALVPGVLGNCLHAADSFSDGDVHSGTFGTVPVKGRRTLSMWLKYGNPGISNLQHCHPFDIGGSMNFQIENLNTFQLQMNLVDKNGKTLIFYGMNAKSKTGYSSMTDRWFHLCITVDAADSFALNEDADLAEIGAPRIAYYIDGIKIDTSVNAQWSTALHDNGDMSTSHYPYTFVPPTATSFTLSFGGAKNRYFPGDVDEFRIYNDVLLTEDQIKRLAQEVNPDRVRVPIAEVSSPADGSELLVGRDSPINGVVHDVGDDSASGLWFVTKGTALITGEGLNALVRAENVGPCRLAVEASNGKFVSRSEPIDLTFVTAVVDDENKSVEIGADTTLKLDEEARFAIGTAYTIDNTANKVFQWTDGGGKIGRMTSEGKFKVVAGTPKNGLTSWQSAVLGLDPTVATSKPIATAPQNQDSAKVAVNLGVDTSKAALLGVTPKFTLKEAANPNFTDATSGEKQEGSSFDITLGGTDEPGVRYFRVDADIADETVQGKNVMGLMKVTSPVKDMLFAVPWVKLSGAAEDEDINVENIVKTAGLSVGDELRVYNDQYDHYDSWTLSEDSETHVKSWGSLKSYKIDGDGKLSEITPANPVSTSVKRGSFFRLNRKANTTNPVYLYGQYTSNAPAWTTVAKGETVVLASPKTQDLSFSTIANTDGVSDSDMFVLPSNSSVGGAQTIVQKLGGKWGFKTTDKDGRSSIVEVKTIPMGTGFWYIKKGNTASTFNW